MCFGRLLVGKVAENMSEAPSRRVEEAKKIMAAQQSLSLEMLTVMSFEAEITEKIESLKQEIEEKNKAITRLHKHV